VSDAPVAAQNAVVCHRFTGLNRHSLHNGFTTYFVLSPVTGFVVTVASVMRRILAGLTPASGRQDHTTSPYATIAVRPALKGACDIIASTASHPNVSNDGQRPSFGTGRTPKAADLGPMKMKIFFVCYLDRANHPETIAEIRLRAQRHRGRRRPDKGSQPAF
jgi:hypothetical protein